MPASDKKDSPFSTSSAGKEKAFTVVSVLAAVSFLCMVAGIYINFIRTPDSSAVFYPARTDQILDKETLINPQPPQRQQTVVKAKPKYVDEKHLIQTLEEERENIKQTAEAFREVVENTPEAAEMEPVLPENEELRLLQQEKDKEEQKKIDEIEALNARRSIHEKRIDPISEDDVPSSPPAAEQRQSRNTVRQNEAPKKADSTGKKKVPESSSDFLMRKTELPQPDLIQTNLMASLPDFSLIKKDGAANAVPLHIITPLPELQEESRYGKLPVEKDGKTSFSAYGKTQSFPPESPYIAILFSGLGKRKNATVAAIAALPDTVSLSFSPYTEKLASYVSDARKAGHETLIDLPMQQGVFPETDPGPLGLVSGLPEQENRKRLRKTLGRNVAFIGVTATANENFSYTGTQMKPFLDEIIQRGLVYIDGTDNPRMPIYPDAIRPDVLIADEFYRSAIRSRLELAKKIALKKGAAFIRIENAPITLLTTVEWMKSFAPTEEKPVPEITFVPLSYHILQKREKR